MEQNTANGTVTLTMDELNKLIEQKKAEAVAAATPEPEWHAPTQIGDTYHDWRAERDAQAAETWDELADASPFGGGLCRIFAGAARTLAGHHARKGFFGKLC